MTTHLRVWAQVGHCGQAGKFPLHQLKAIWPLKETIVNLIEIWAVQVNEAPGFGALQCKYPSIIRRPQNTNKLYTYTENQSLTKINNGHAWHYNNNHYLLLTLVLNIVFMLWNIWQGEICLKLYSLHIHILYISETWEWTTNWQLQQKHLMISNKVFVE